jgi:xanthine/uracil/vitamin C permease (AzgA family)
VLVLVAVLMMQGLARIDMSDLVNAVPIVLTLLVTTLTNNLINGMAWGTLSYIRPSSGTRTSPWAAAPRFQRGDWGWCSLAMRS